MNRSLTEVVPRDSGIWSNSFSTSAPATLGQRDTECGESHTPGLASAVKTRSASAVRPFIASQRGEYGRKKVERQSAEEKKTWSRKGTRQAHELSLRRLPLLEPKQLRAVS